MVIIDVGLVEVYMFWDWNSMFELVIVLKYVC